MKDLKTIFHGFQKKHLQLAGVLFLVLLALFLLWFNDSRSWQPPLAFRAEVYFDGEYRIGDGEWQPIEAGKHIPATKET